MTLTNIRICFKLGDADAKRLSDGFAHFESQDLQSLGIGETIMRIGSSSDDFNLETLPLPKDTTDYKEQIIVNTRANYAQSKEDIKTILEELLPKSHARHQKKTREVKPDNITVETKADQPEELVIQETEGQSVLPQTSLEEQKQKYLQQEEEKDRKRKHRTLQNFVKTVAFQHGYKVSIEKQTGNDGRIDVELIRDNVSIAVEISVTNSTQYEVKNIQKCLDENYHYIFLLSESEVHLRNIKQLVQKNIDESSKAKIFFTNSLSFPEKLNSLFENKPETTVKRFRGYRVKTNQVNVNKAQSNEKRSGLGDVIMRSIKKIKGK